VIADLGNGLVKMQAGPFPELRLAPFGNDYRGPLAVRETPTKFVLGGAGRLQVRARYAASYPVVAEWAGLAWPPDDLDESIVFGGGYTVFVAVENPFPGPWAGNVVWRMYERLAACNVRLTTRRPNDLPVSYGQCVVSTTLAAVPDGPFLRSGGGALTDRFALPWDEGERNSVRVVYVVALRDWAQTASDAVHEILHGFGEQHDQTPGSVMYDKFNDPNSRVLPETAARVRLRTGRFT
jgi:hypothetical protein